MMGRAWLLMRHGGCLWAVAGEDVRQVEAPGGGYHLRLGNHLLEVDEVVSFSSLRGIRPIGRVLRGIAPPGCSALALCELGPVLMIDGQSPPAVLLAAGESDAGDDTGKRADVGDG